MNYYVYVYASAKKREFDMSAPFLFPRQKSDTVSRDALFLGEQRDGGVCRRRDITSG